MSIIGVDSGAAAGIVTGCSAGGLWIAAAAADSTHPTAAQTIVRVGILCVLGFGSGVVGSQLRTSERARATTVARQRALIDATIDGICLTDVDGNILIVNEPLVRMAIDLGMPPDGIFRHNNRTGQPVVDYAAQEREVLGMAEQLLSDNPDVGAIVSECTNLPPYSAKIEQTFGVPVYDIVGFVEWFHTGLKPRRYTD